MCLYQKLEFFSCDVVYVSFLAWIAVQLVLKIHTPYA
jgi:hypothetical protein